MLNLLHLSIIARIVFRKLLKNDPTIRIRFKFSEISSNFSFQFPCTEDNRQVLNSFLFVSMVKYLSLYSISHFSPFTNETNIEIFDRRSAPLKSTESLAKTERCWLKESRPKLDILNLAISPFF